MELWAQQEEDKWLVRLRFRHEVCTFGLPSSMLVFCFYMHRCLLDGALPLFSESLPMWYQAMVVRFSAMIPFLIIDGRVASWMEHVGGPDMQRGR